MSKEIYISSTPHETRLAIVENDALTEIYYERENEYTLAGSIYNGKVTRVLPGMQSSFVDIGLERDAFLYITDFMEEAGDSADFDTNGNGDSRRRATATRPHHRRHSRHRSGQGEHPHRPRRPQQPWRPRPWPWPSRPQRQPRPPAHLRNLAPSDSLETQNTQDTQDFSRDDFSSAAGSTPDDAPIARTGDTDLAKALPEPMAAAAGVAVVAAVVAVAPVSATSPVSRLKPQQPQPANSPSEISYGDDSFDIDGSCRASHAPSPPTLSRSQPRPAQENTSRNDSGDRDRNNRGGRDRNRNDRNRGRGDRGGRDTPDARAPRGFAPRTSLYGVDDSSSLQRDPPTQDARAEPIVLPGESLSKYRKDGERPTASAAKPADANVIIPLRSGVSPFPQAGTAATRSPARSLVTAAEAPEPRPNIVSDSGRTEQQPGRTPEHEN